MSDNKQSVYERHLAKMRQANDYTLSHLIDHLRSIEQSQKIHQLLLGNQAWMQANFERFHGDKKYVSEVDLSLSAFSDPLSAEGLSVFFQLWTVRRLVETRSQVHDEDLAILVLFGEEEFALNYALLREEPRDQFDGLHTIFEQLYYRGQTLHPELLRQIRQTIDAIDDVFLQCEARMHLAFSLHEMGEYEQAYEEFEKGYELAVHSDVSNEIRFECLKELSIFLGFIGEVPRLVDLLNKLDDEDEREITLFLLLGLLATNKKLDIAGRVIQALNLERIEVESLFSGIHLLVMLDSDTEISEDDFTNTFSDPLQRKLLLEYLISEENFEKAEAELSILSVSKFQMEMQIALAEGLTEKFPEKARALLNQIDETLIDESVVREMDREHLLSALGIAYAQLGCTNEATRTANCVRYLEGKASIWRAIARNHWENGDRPAAREALVKSREQLRELHLLRRWHEALTVLVYSLISTNHLVIAEKFVDLIPNEQDVTKVVLYSAISAAWFTQGNAQRAEQLIRLVDSYVDQMELQWCSLHSPLTPILALLMHIAVLTQINNFDRAVQLCKTIWKVEARLKGFSTIAKTAREKALPDVMNTAIREIREIFENIDTDYRGRMQAITTLAVLFWETDRYEEAETTFSEARDLLRFFAPEVDVLIDGMLEVGKEQEALSLFESYREHSSNSGFTFIQYYSQKRQFDIAQVWIEKLPTEDRDKAKTYLVEQLLEAGQIDDAQGLTTEIEKISVRVEALGKILVKLTEHEQSDRCCSMP